MYIPKRKVVCAMISEIDFKVKGETVSSFV